MKSLENRFIIYAFFSLFFALSFIVFPQHTYEASVRGMSIWWNIVFPSLLPFFIIADLLIHVGVVRMIGKFLEPLMRPLFKIPGSGAFVIALGMASGFPAGAKLTAHLRKEQILTRTEAERLVSFSNSSNPLFIFGAVAVGFFHNESLGIILAISHYVGNLFVGFFMRFYRPKYDDSSTESPANDGQFFYSELKPLGELLGNAVYSSIRTLFMIGGFIMLFSVIHEILSLLHITTVFAFLFQLVFFFLPFHHELSAPFISGLLEVTLGSQKVSGLSNVPLLHQLLMISFLLGFNGFSVHAQVASILAKTDIRFSPFFFARIAHGLLSSGICYLIFPFFISLHDTSFTSGLTEHNPSFFATLYYWFIQYGGWITFFVLVSFLYMGIKKISPR